MAHEPVILSAQWVMPVCGAAIDGGAVVIENGRIAAVGKLADIQRQFPGARHENFAGHALLPGLVNAHTHLELGYLRGAISPSHFVDWVLRLIKLSGKVQDVAQTVGESVRAGIAESLRAGVTTLGDISKQINESRIAAKNGPARIVSFGELQVLGRKRDLLDERLSVAADERHNSPTLSTGISPHAPYTVEGPALKKILALADEKKLPICMHLAELAEEREFLQNLSGRIREAWDSAGIAAYLLDDKVPIFNDGPIKWAAHWGLLAASHPAPVLLAHVNYATDEELDLLAQSDAHVAYCPRTRHFFGHDAASRHPFEKMLSRGINVCLGTDSLASNPDLSLLKEAAFVAKLFPQVPHDIILEMITTRGARALGLSKQVGAIAAGMNADIIALPLPENCRDASAALSHIITTAPVPSHVWVSGKLLC